MSYFLEWLALFISRNALFLQEYGNVVLVTIMVMVFLASRWVQRQHQWKKSVRWGVWSILFIGNLIAGSITYMINWPLKPMVVSLSKVQRNLGSRMNNFSFTLLGDAQPHAMTDYRGKVIVLNFWATYCGGCIEEFPDLKRVEAAHGGDVVVIALSDEDREKLARVVPRLDAPPLTGYYSNEEWMKLESFRPVTLILDRDGIIRECKWGRTTFTELESMVSHYL